MNRMSLGRLVKRIVRIQSKIIRLLGIIFRNAFKTDRRLPLSTRNNELQELPHRLNAAYSSLFYPLICSFY